MFFLIEYNRPKEHIVTFRKFKDSDKVKAQSLKLKIELELNKKKVNHEVVLLEAARESLLRRTHRRYFESLRDIVKSVS